MMHHEIIGITVILYTAKPFLLHIRSLILVPRPGTQKFQKNQPMPRFQNAFLSAKLGRLECGAPG